MTIIYDKIAIIGVGLIGASIALAARRGIAAASPEARSFGQAGERKARACRPCDNRRRRCGEDADLVVMAVPVGILGQLAAQIVPAMKPSAVLTLPDQPSGPSFAMSTRITVTFTGSRHTRLPVPNIPVRRPASPNCSRPVLAGSARRCPGRRGRSLRELRHRHGVRQRTHGRRLPRQGAGADIPSAHLIAYTIVGTAVDLESQLKNDVIRFSASGFRDFTRIAASDPVMWRDVFINNDEAVLEMLQRFRGSVLSAGPSGGARRTSWRCSAAREIRRSIIDAGQS